MTEKWAAFAGQDVPAEAGAAETGSSAETGAGAEMNAAARERADSGENSPAAEPAAPSAGTEIEEEVPPLEPLPQLPGRISPAGETPADSGEAATVIPQMQMD